MQTPKSLLIQQQKESEEMRKSFEIIVDFVERWNKQDGEREVANAVIDFEDSIVKLQDFHSSLFPLLKKKFVQCNEIHNRREK